MEKSVRKILIVDDSSDDHRIFKRMLRKAERHSYDVVSATEAAGGLAAVRAHSFDCILLDINLPGQSGLDLLTELSRQYGFGLCAVVVITGDGNESVAVEAMQRGAQDYLSKVGLGAGTLERAIDRASEKRILQAQLECSLQVSTEMNRLLQLEIEERKKAELVAAAAKEQAELANEAKTAFLTNMSHELRTPMNGILGMTSLLLESALADEQRQFATAIRRSANALLSLLNDILDVSKLEARQLELETIDFDLEELIDDTLEAVSVTAADKDVELCALVEESALHQYHGDPTRLRQVMLNLIGNAVKFTKAGSVTVRAHVVSPDTSGTPVPALLRIDVTDTGIGISDDGLSRLFQKFHQADNSITRRFGGSGLGLAISRELAELMGGRIEVASTLGQGSTFSLVVGLPQGPPLASPAPWTKRLANRPILIVDDLDLARRALRRRLERKGIEVTEAHDGPSALAALHRASAAGRGFDAAFIDQVMPGMSGEEVAQEIDEIPALASVKIVLMSLLGIAAKTGGAGRVRIDAVLTKPQSRKAVAACLAHLLFPDETLIAKENTSFLADQDVQDRHRNVQRILLAEDNVINQQVASGILRRAGYTVDVVDDGVAAVDAARRTRYDIILMDLQMPEMGGVEATDIIRKLDGFQYTPIIAMTAYAMQGTREECVRAGMDDYVAKPFDPRGFLAVVRRWASATDARSAADAPQAAPESSDPLLIDENHIAALRATMAASDFDALMAGVPARLQDRVGRLQSVFATGDLAALEHEAHKLISGAGNVGATALSMLAREIETSASTQDRSTVDSLMGAIGGKTSATLAALSARNLAA
jgi:signal transduction histidine kinase/HPt (histidine-containing phosphotransfer) domain-containing protein